MYEMAHATKPRMAHSIREMDRIELQDRTERTDEYLYQCYTCKQEVFNICKVIRTNEDERTDTYAKLSRIFSFPGVKQKQLFVIYKNIPTLSKIYDSFRSLYHEAIYLMNLMARNNTLMEGVGGGRDGYAAGGGGAGVGGGGGCQCAGQAFRWLALPSGPPGPDGNAEPAGVPGMPGPDGQARGAPPAGPHEPPEAPVNDG
ncbi:hypothetical protein L5515_012519 [Caenorhabditis briggsae]|uniref:Uncharacterized protein n=1 Tax=Caenorhabditis briggsae TaxID=6238 RepID=A0AAE9F127_CAEBR|nr:hypothetical protein L5515_012519 [Caenorhabditis briggsae]